MAMTLAATMAAASEAGLRFTRKGLARLLFDVPTKRYRNLRREPTLHVVLELVEDGEYVRFHAPRAFEASGPHASSVVAACLSIQWLTKLIQFELEPETGEVRPMIEFPLEDGTLTSRQISRCIRGMATLLDDYAMTLEKAASTGLIQFPKPHVAPDLARIRLAIKALLPPGSPPSSLPEGGDSGARPEAPTPS